MLALRVEDQLDTPLCHLQYFINTRHRDSYLSTYTLCLALMVSPYCLTLLYLFEEREKGDLFICIYLRGRRERQRETSQKLWLTRPNLGARDLIWAIHVVDSDRTMRVIACWSSRMPTNWKLGVRVELGLEPGHSKVGGKCLKGWLTITPKSCPLLNILKFQSDLFSMCLRISTRLQISFSMSTFMFLLHSPDFMCTVTTLWNSPCDSSVVSWLLSFIIL